MINKIKQLLNPDEDSEPYQQIETIVSDLENGIQNVNLQYKKTQHQEQKILEKLTAYHNQYEEVKGHAKKAFSEKNNNLTESLLQECDLLDTQISQYQNLIAQIHQTQKKLTVQKNQFSLTIDKLTSQITLGEAETDASQLRANMEERMMLLSESGELNRFDELIAEADSKTQALQEIQESANEFEVHFEKKPQRSLNEFELEIRKEEAQKLQTSLENQQKIITQIFGKTESSKDDIQKKKQRKLLDNLRSSRYSESSKEQFLKEFFKVENHGKETDESTDRLDAFFKRTPSKSPSSESRKDVINQFFHNK